MIDECCIGGEKSEHIVSTTNMSIPFWLFLLPHHLNFDVIILNCIWVRYSRLLFMMLASSMIVCILLDWFGWNLTITNIFVDSFEYIFYFLFPLCTNVCLLLLYYLSGMWETASLCDVQKWLMFLALMNWRGVLRLHLWFLLILLLHMMQMIINIFNAYDKGKKTSICVIHNCKLIFINFSS